MSNWLTEERNLKNIIKGKITSRTTGAKGNKFLRVITSFNEEVSCIYTDK